MKSGSPTPSTQRVIVGLIGRGLGASRSPAMHEAEADAQGIRLIYTRFDFSARGYADSELPPLLAALELAGYSGVNVTHPFKQAVIAHLDELSPGARQVGAVNTVVFRRGKRIGYNTDAPGFAHAFDAGLADVETARVVLLGAGGAGSAVALALLERGIHRLTIVDPDEERAAALVARLKPRFGVRRMPASQGLERDVARANGIVNATPLGMTSHPGSAVPAALLRPDLWVADVVYFPLETALLAAARAAGCRVLNGSGMAVWQAAEAFELFTGWRANAARMRQTFDAFDRLDEWKPPKKRRGRKPKSEL